MRVLAQNGAFKSPSHLTKRPRLSSRSPRQHRKSGTKSESSNPELQSKPSESNPSPGPARENTNANAAQPKDTPPSPPPPGSVASSAGAPTPPVPPATAVRSLRESIARGPLGKLARGYARVQERRPYATQICSSVVIYLCGDLSAQMLFPTERPQTGEGDADGGRTGGYDPARTTRHLTVGVGSSIPTYHW